MSAGIVLCYFPPLRDAWKVKCKGLVMKIFVTHSPKVGASCLAPDVGCIFLADFSEGPSDESRSSASPWLPLHAAESAEVSLLALARVACLGDPSRL